MSTYHWLMAGFITVVLMTILGVTPRFAVGQAPESSILITEIYYNTPGDDSVEEWIEIANVGMYDLDISGFMIGDEESAGGGEGMMQFPPGTVLPAGAVLLVTQTAVGFRNLFGTTPDFEFRESEWGVANMLPSPEWAAGDIGLANGGDEVLLLDATGMLLDGVSYGENHTFFLPTIADSWQGQSIERVPANCDSDSAADWQPRRHPTPGDITLNGECAIESVSYGDLLPIGAIQGAGDLSPYINQVVAFHGIVTGFYEDRNTNGLIFYTLFVQDAPGQADSDPATSDGIAVFMGQQRPQFSIGQPVRITGQVTEFFGLTEINDDGLIIQPDDNPENRGLPEPEPMMFLLDPEAQKAYGEAHEAMRLSLPGTSRVVGPTHSGCGLVVIAGTEMPPRLFRRQEQDPLPPVLPLLHHSDIDCAPFPAAQSGDLLSGLVGPLTYHFDEYKLVQQDPEALQLIVTETAVVAPPPPLTDNQISIATFNLENLFDGQDDTGNIAEPKLSSAEIETRIRKLAHTISAVLVCPTLIGVQEVENGALLRLLAEQAASACGFTYDVIHRESVDQRGIDVALLAQPEVITAVSAQLHQTCTALDTGISDDSIICPPGQQPLFSRPPLQVDVRVNGRSLSVYVNHFKSKRGESAETAPRRLAQAQFIARLVDTQLAQNREEWVVVMGDFNDYEQSAALQTIAAAGLTNVLRQLPDATRYSFVYGGISQLIDGILLSPRLADAVDWVGIQHINADFPFAWQWETAPVHFPYRSADHDPSLVILHLPPETLERPDMSPATAVMGPSPTISLETPDAAIRHPITPTPETMASPVPMGKTANRSLLPGIGLLVIGLTCLLLCQKRE